ncbi:hypothetical protein BTO30_01375 [Domibacillus antri]|uniref:Multidrug ABC transporter permease n=1 Tax=Domibacillus antri TaxID=1714264 RepID=A0A1Q8Q9S2_9BACI|nr:ABC transporter permease [Domibacillus antri]OLN24094.1 hypothetical protein BTO30_01375 [Domibacillus antri]
MKSGILSFNKGLFMQHSRSILWISVFFLLSQIILLPLGMMIALRDEWNIQYLIESNPRNFLFAISYALQYLSYIVFPVLAGIILTSYMTKKGSSDFVHSLPFKRETLLTHVYAAGAVSLIVPILINAVILLMMRPFVKPITYTMGQLAEWAGVSIFIVIFMFVITVMIGLFIGSAILQGIMAYGILVLPAGLVVITLSNARYFISGLAVDSYTAKMMEDGSFLIRAAAFNMRPFTGVEWAVYLVLIAVIIAVSYYVYKVRPAEAGDETIVFPFFRWAFIFILTYAGMLLGGVYFGQFLGGSMAWLIAGYVIGAFVSYTVLQMIVQKSLRLVWPWKGFSFYVLGLFILLIPGTFAAKAYENAIPETDEIEKVYIGDSAEPFEHYFYLEEEQEKLKKADAGFMRGENSIEQVRDVHEQLIDLGNGITMYDHYPVSITYVLKDGSRVQRQYAVQKDELVKATGELRKNVEFIRASNVLFAITNPADITYLTGYDGNGGTQLGNTADKEDIEAIRSALEKEILSSEAELFNHRYGTSAGSLEFAFGKQHGITVSVNVNFDDAAVLKEIRERIPGGERFASADNVAKAFIVTANTEEQKTELEDFVWTESEEGPDWRDLPLPFEEIKDKEEIKQLLDPDGIADDSDRFLVLEWQNSGGWASISVIPLKE